MENSTALDIDADLISLGDIIRIPGERRRYRVAGVRRTVLIPTRSQDIDPADRARVTVDLRPVSAGGTATTRQLRPTDRVLAY